MYGEAVVAGGSEGVDESGGESEVGRGEPKRGRRKSWAEGE